MSKRFFWLIIVLVVLAGGIVGGFWLGKKISGNRTAAFKAGPGGKEALTEKEAGYLNRAYGTPPGKEPAVIPGSPGSRTGAEVLKTLREVQEINRMNTQNEK
ncbi:hypothetical protein KAR10_05485 [bacterium]|nr:hypothetical protein [bacterium]